MTYTIKINVDENNKHLVEELLEKLDCEVTKDRTKKIRLKKKLIAPSPTMLFGKWKNIDLDPVTFRKELWLRKR